MVTSMRAIAAFALVLTSCTTISITVSRRAEPPERSRTASAEDQPLPLTLPRSPLLNRLDLFEAGSDRMPEELVGFQDYFEREGRPPGLADLPPMWARSAPLEQELASRLRARMCPAQEPAAPTSTSVSRPLLSFLHFTDVQIREARAKLLDERQSKGLDQVVDSFEHDFQQELHIDVMFEALVATANATAKQAVGGRSHWYRQPAFAIHTGDAVDAGLASELTVFRNVMDQLRVYGEDDAELSLPWLGAIGNHDVLTFGNFIPGSSIPTSTLLDGARSELSRRWYWRSLAFISKADWHLEPQLDLRACPGCADRFLASRATGPGFIERFVEGHADPRPDRLGDRVTTHHGYDLNTDAGGHKLGYYRFELPLDGGGTFRGVVLNTDDYGDVPPGERGGEGGWIGEAQLQWLHQQLTGELENTVVMVFAHHPVHTIRFRGNRLRLAAELLEAAGRGHLLAFVVGHNHAHDVRLLRCDSPELAERGPGRARLDEVCRAVRAAPRPCGVKTPGLWQIQTAAVIGFPQEARAITLRKLDDRVGFLELMPIHHTFLFDGKTPFRQLLERAEQGAIRDECRLGGCLHGNPLRRDGAAGAVRLFVPLPPLTPRGSP